MREIGCSNFTVEQLAEAKAAVKADSARFVSVQNEYSLLHREPEAGVLEACASEGVGAYLNFQHLLTEQNLELFEKLVAFAEAREHTLLELAFGWLLAHRPVVSVIAGASKAEQVQANARAAEWALSDADFAEIDAELTQGAYSPARSK